MNFYRIPIDQPQYWYDFPIVLSGTRYLLEVRYNQRMDRWFLTISTAAGEPILSGVPLLINREYFGQYPTLPLPPGAMFAICNTVAQTQPGVSGFLTDHDLIFGEPT